MSNHKLTPEMEMVMAYAGYAYEPLDTQAARFPELPAHKVQEVTEEADILWYSIKQGELKDIPVFFEWIEELKLLAQQEKEDR